MKKQMYFGLFMFLFSALLMISFVSATEYCTEQTIENECRNLGFDFGVSKFACNEGNWSLLNQTILGSIVTGNCEDIYVNVGNSTATGVIVWIDENTFYRLDGEEGHISQENTSHKFITFCGVNNNETNQTIICDEGYELIDNDCVQITCNEGYHLEGNDCIIDDNGDNGNEDDDDDNGRGRSKNKSPGVISFDLTPQEACALSGNCVGTTKVIVEEILVDVENLNIAGKKSSNNAYIMILLILLFVLLLIILMILLTRNK